MKPINIIKIFEVLLADELYSSNDQIKYRLQDKEQTILGASRVSVFVREACRGKKERVEEQ
ncbi:hypothetical protein NECAME_07332 [Necator americanus]|uniref:Uncharacterized protein n=1 Tax=Necator americanus TaxID=51031 RepID=W2TPG0_NECAM|nr:hypothetical protein NECAME_07332 [Necator americanus]ETN83574.1 hypothetical protein NECAME_07332 [Necator americanus]